jgi:saccharopine dehydrogenase (NAD+, L-lysine-forming)
MERAGGWLNQYTVVKQGMISYEIATGQASTKNKPKLEVLQNVGMTRIDPVHFKGMDIVPLEFLKALLPAPDSLGQNYTGQTSIGCQIKGVKDGADRTYFIWNNCDHAETYREVRGQAVSYTTGVPAMIGAMLMLRACG